MKRGRIGKVYWINPYNTGCKTELVNKAESLWQNEDNGTVLQDNTLYVLYNYAWVISTGRKA